MVAEVLTSRSGTGEGGLAQFGAIRADRKRGGEGECKNWTFFLNALNVWSLNFDSFREF